MDLTSIVIVPAVCTVLNGIADRPAALNKALGLVSTGGGVIEVDACAKFPWLNDLLLTWTKFTTCPRDVALLPLALFKARPVDWEVDDRGSPKPFLWSFEMEKLTRSLNIGD